MWPYLQFWRLKILSPTIVGVPLLKHACASKSVVGRGAEEHRSATGDLVTCVTI